MNGVGAYEDVYKAKDSCGHKYEQWVKTYNYIAGDELVAHLLGSTPVAISEIRSQLEKVGWVFTGEDVHGISYWRVWQRPFKFDDPPIKRI